MPKFKTAKQISAEVSALTTIKPNVRHFSAFGDNHWEAIEAQIIVLKYALELMGVLADMLGPGFAPQEETCGMPPENLPVRHLLLTPARLCAKAEEFENTDEEGEPTDNDKVYDEALAACDWLCGESDNATLVETWEELVVTHQMTAAGQQSVKDKLDKAVYRIAAAKAKSKAKPGKPGKERS